MFARLLFGVAFLSFVLPLSAEDQPVEKQAASTSGSTESHPTKGAIPTEFDSFMVVLLVRPPHPPEMTKPELDQLQEKHLANIRRLADEGKILKAGPFEDYSGRNVRGMFILKTESLEEARAWVNTDPSVQAGRLQAEYLKWYVEKGSLK